MTEIKNFIAYTIDHEPLKDIFKFIEDNKGIAFNGKIPHKILHITARQPKITTEETALQELKILKETILKEKLKKPDNFTIENIITYPNSTKIILTGKLNGNIKIKNPHIAIAEFKDNKTAYSFLQNNKTEFEKLKGLELKVLDLEVIEKGKGILYQDINIEDVKKTYDLVSNYEEIEIRVIEPKKDSKNINRFFVKTREEFIHIAKTYSNKPIRDIRYNIYFGVNEREINKGSEKNVLRALILPIDLDYKRPSLTSTTDKQLEETKQIAEQLQKDFFVKKGFLKPSMAMSGNGVGLYLKIKPQEFKSYEELLAFKEKWTAFTKEIRMFVGKLTKNINVDSIQDLSRIFKIVGTKSVKGDKHRLTYWINYNNTEDEKLTDYILKTKPEGTLKTVETKLKTISLTDEKIKKIINSNIGIKKIIEGNIEGYKSRNEAELGLTVKLMNKGILAYEEIDKVLQSSKIGKWQERTEGNYKRKLYNKALSFYNENKDHLTTGIDNREEKAFCGVKYFNNSTTVFLGTKAEIYNHKKRIEKNKGVYWTTEYSLYEGSIGEGNTPIFIKTKYKIDFGDNNLFLRPLDKKEIETMLWYMKSKFLCYTLCKKLFVKITKGKGDDREAREKEEIINDILKLDYTFFEPMLPIDKENIKLIENPLTTILKILRSGLTKSKALDYIYSSDIPEVNPYLIEPKYYMRFAGHKIIVTNQKVGKSFNSLFVAGEPSLERPSMAGLLGFADSQKRSYGKLHNRTKHTYVEEVQEEGEQEIFGKLHTYMEIGETTIARGLGINIKGYSGVTFEGNPKTKEDIEDKGLEQYLMIKQFRDFLTILSRNTRPFSSRIGLILFDSNMKKVTGTPKDNIVFDKGQKIIRTIAEGFRDEFTKLFFNNEIFEWLNKEFDEEYIKTITNIANDCGDNVVSDYLLGQIDSYRHTRGTALNLAWLDKGLKSLWDNGKVNIEELLESAEDHLQQIKQINIKSYTNIVNLLDSETYEKILKYNITNIRPEYVKLSVYTLFEWILDNPENSDKIIPLTEIQGYYNNVKDYLEIGLNHKYRSFATIKKYFKKFRGSHLETFGLDYDSQKECFIILNTNKTIKYSELYKVTKVTKDTETKHKEESSKDTKVTKVTVEEYNKNNKVEKVDKVEEELVANLVTLEDLADYIKQNDKGQGVSKQQIANYSDNPDIEVLMDKALEQGLAFENKGGYLKLL